jgi:hypothetical protein
VAEGGGGGVWKPVENHGKTQKTRGRLSQTWV